MANPYPTLDQATLEPRRFSAWQKAACDMCGNEHQAARGEPRTLEIGEPLLCGECQIRLPLGERIEELEEQLAHRDQQIRRLRSLLIEIVRDSGGNATDDVSDDFLANVPRDVAARVAERDREIVSAVEKVAEKEAVALEITKRSELVFAELQSDLSAAQARVKELEDEIRASEVIDALEGALAPVEKLERLEARCRAFEEQTTSQGQHIATLESRLRELTELPEVE